MLQQLQELSAWSDREHPYLSREPVQQLRRRLETLPPGTAVEEEARLRVTLGQGELRLGNLEPAIAQMEAAYALLEGFPPNVRRSARQSLAYQLGLAYLRLGETENCLEHHNAASCLLPIAPEAVHRIERGSKAAMKHFREVMALSETDSTARLSARWLLNLAAMTLGYHPDGLAEHELVPADTFSSAQSFPRFQEIAGPLGLATVDLSGGAAAEDFDGDGRLDLVVSSWDSRGQLRFFRREADGSFRERTVEAGLSGLWGGLNLTTADYDNDGDVDVLVLRGAWVYGDQGRHPNSLLRNNGDGTFRDVTFEAGLARESYPTQTAAWADYDNDGDLDLYVGNEASAEQRFPGQLFRNQGDGTFTDVAAAAGVENLRFAKGVAWGDYDGDRFADLYVSNLGQPNRLYRNQGDGTFVDVAERLGVGRPMDSFPAWFWDFDNDGKLDLFVASYFQSVPPDRLAAVAGSYLGLPHRGEPHHLYQGNGSGFREVGRQLGLERITLTMGANFGDLDNDGYLDFYLGTGYPYFDGQVPNVMYRNRQGRGFADVSSEGGFGHLQKGHAVVFADLDRDGDQDVFEQMGGAYPSEAYGNVLYENPGFGGHWLKVKLVGTRSNRSAVGARLKVEFEEQGRLRRVFRWVGTGGSFGANPLTQHVGLGSAERVALLEVFWPASGTTQEFRDLEADQLVRVEEGSAKIRTLPHQALPFRKSAPAHVH